jgi:hypothetical protein
MDVSAVFGISLSGLFFVIFLCQSSASVSASRLRGSIVFTFLRLLGYPLLVKTHRAARNMTRYQALTITIYWILNGLAMGLNIQSFTQFRDRVGTLSAINAIPLFLGRSNLLLTILGFSPGTLWISHHWIGRLSILQAVIHSSIAISQDQSISERFRAFGLAAAVILVAIFVSTLIWCRTHFEWMGPIHSIFALTYAACLVIHLLGLTLMALPIACLGIWFIHGIYLLVRAYRYRGTATLEEVTSGTMIRIRTKRHWNFTGGQYVSVRFLDTHRSFRYQRFYLPVIGQREKYDEQGKYFETSLFAEMVPFRDKTSEVHMSGPYGSGVDLTDYAKLVMIADGHSIAQVLPYAKRLLEQKRDGIISLEQLKIIWLHSEKKHWWAVEWLLELLKLDCQTTRSGFPEFDPEESGTELGEIHNEQKEILKIMEQSHKTPDSTVWRQEVLHMLQDADGRLQIIELHMYPDDRKPDRKLEIKNREPFGDRNRSFRYPKQVPNLAETIRELSDDPTKRKKAVIGKQKHAHTKPTNKALVASPSDYAASIRTIFLENQKPGMHLFELQNPL